MTFLAAMLKPFFLVAILFVFYLARRLAGMLPDCWLKRLLLLKVD